MGQSDGQLGKVNELRITEPSELITDEALQNLRLSCFQKNNSACDYWGNLAMSLTEIVCCANRLLEFCAPSRSREYIYSWINQIIDKLVASQTGGAQQHINKGNVQEAPILLPSAKVLRPSFLRQDLHLIKSFGRFSSNLTKLRDTLLPKLISGELGYPNAEQHTERAIA